MTKIYETAAKSFAADGVTQTYEVRGLPILVNAVDFNRVYSELAALRTEFEQVAVQGEPVACASMCNLCLERGFNLCANLVNVTRTPPQPAAAAAQAEPVQLIATCDRPGGCDCGTPNICCDHYVEPDEPATAVQAEPVALFQCDVTARPLDYPLSDYHKAPAEGPPNFTWEDKPHRLLYDLIAALKWYTTPRQPVSEQRTDMPAPWHHRILKAHPKSEPEFWPDELRLKYMADELEEYRANWAQSLKSVDTGKHRRKTCEGGVARPVNGYEIAASLSDAESEKWLKKAQKHLPRYRSDCADRDLVRAKLFSDFSKKIRSAQPVPPIVSEVTDALVKALKLALEHGGFEQGSGVIHEIRNALKAAIARPAAQAEPLQDVKDGEPKLEVWYGKMPESCGRTNWTARLMGHGGDYTIDRSEYPGRVRYAADCVRHIIGELPEKPFIFDYNGDEFTCCHLCGGSGEKDGKPCPGLNFKGTVHPITASSVKPAAQMQDVEVLAPDQSSGKHMPISNGTAHKCEKAKP